jgi:hypothetical protein
MYIHNGKGDAFQPQGKLSELLGVQVRDNRCSLRLFL